METLFYFLNEGIVRALHKIATAHPIAGQLIFFSAETLPFIVVLAVAVLALCYFFGGDRRMAGVTAGALTAALLSWSVAHVLKWWFATDRPHMVLQTITPVFAHDGHAFPSGHAAFFFALAFVLWQADRRLGIAGMVAAVCISVARVAAGVHWPVDILGGFVVGCLISYVTFRIIRIGVLRTPLHSR